MIPYGRQDITEADIEKVVEVLRSDLITQGPVVPEFEGAVSKYCKAKYAVATNSATSALHIACLALGLGSGDWLWTSPITFVASANCGLYCGAHVDFVDIDESTYNISIASLALKLENAERQGRLPKIVVPVHFAGQSCDMQAIHELSQKYNFKVLEDASHAIGGRYQGEPVGGCQYSDVTVFSFHPVKIITSAEGGIATTNNPLLAQTMSRLRSHGVTRDRNEMEDTQAANWVYEQKDLGYNYRMTDILAALGLSQLNRLDEYITVRNDLANSYHHLLQNLPLTLPYCISEAYSAYHLYVVGLDFAEGEHQREIIFDRLRDVGIGVNVHYIPVHTQPVYRRIGFKTGDYPVAERYYKRALTLPLYPKLKLTELEYIVSHLKSLIAEERSLNKYAG